VEHLEFPLDAVPLYLTALAIYVPRPLALFSILPIMTRLGLPRFLQLALVIVIGLPAAAPMISQIQQVHPLSATSTVALSLKEAFVGVLIGLIMGIPFWAMEIAGNILDFTRQAPDAEVQDPRNTTEATVTGTLFSIFASLYFIAAGGLTIIIDTIYKSYEIWPALSELPQLNGTAAGKLLQILDALFKSSLVIAGPILIFVLVSFFVLIIIARFIPQTNVFSLSLSFKNIAFFTAIQIYGAYAISYFVLNSNYLKGTLTVMKGLLGEQ
jgi:type III secretion protein T